MRVIEIWSLVEYRLGEDRLVLRNPYMVNKPLVSKLLIKMKHMQMMLFIMHCCLTLFSFAGHSVSL